VEKSLLVTQNGKELFTSNSKWLYPLFELEDFLSKNEFLPENLYLTDKIAGKAAAFLIVRLGLKNVHIHLISEGGIAVFNRFKIGFTYDELVPKIQCKTEEIVSGDESIDAVWQMLRRRAGRVSGLTVDVTGLTVEVAGKVVLENLNLHVGKGEHVFIKGANGVGKTTLLKAMLGLEKVAKGTITIGNYEVGSSDWDKKRSITGYVHQEMVKNSFPISAAEVVEIGLAGHQIKKTELLHRTEIAMRRTGCLQLAKRSYHELSGGEKQRVNIARCLCQGAKVLLFDEPTSFLDKSSKDELHELLTELWANEAPTAIIVSHDDHWITKFNNTVYELSDGKIC
jgi:ABC-type cobalamin/Fe3+-siderophores transport system ATPase subunit